MRFSDFILGNIEPILAEWELFAKSLPPGQNMTSAALRNDAERMLRFIAADMESAQSEDERAVKGKGNKAFVGEDSAAHAHGRLRLLQAFDLAEMVSEFRALRASVIRLWSVQAGAVPLAASAELVRFNEAMDQILAESVQRYAREMERSRELLLAVLGHDLRNPLSSIRMSAEILARSDLTPGQSKYAAAILQASERMRRMVRDLLDFTRTRLGAKLLVAAQQCDLCAVCRDIAEEARSGHPDREVIVESSGDCVGHWDPERMAQLVSNLVGNAIQHGHQNTPVKITTAGGNSDWVTLVVKNQGPAIPLEHRSSIFDAMNRTSQADHPAEAGSLGLGLYIAKEIALAHGGGLKLLYSDESGTAFEARLPRGAPTA